MKCILYNIIRFKGGGVMEQSTIDCLIMIASYLFMFGLAVILEANKKMNKRKKRGQ